MAAGDHRRWAEIQGQVIQVVVRRGDEDRYPHTRVGSDISGQTQWLPIDVQAHLPARAGDPQAATGYLAIIAQHGACGGKHWLTIYQME